jgi:hypothetical protein
MSARLPHAEPAEHVCTDPIECLHPAHGPVYAPGCEPDRSPWCVGPADLSDRDRIAAFLAEVDRTAAAGGVPEHYCPTCGSAIVNGYCSNPACSSYADSAASGRAGVAR